MFLYLVTAALAVTQGTEPFVFSLEQGQAVLDPVAVQHALSAELRRPVHREEGAKPDADWLRIKVDGERRATLTFQPKSGETRTHEVRLPEDGLQAVEVTALASGNLVRREAFELAARLAPPRPATATAQPVTVRQVDPRAPEVDRHAGRLALSATGGIGFAGFPAVYDVAVAYRWTALALSLDMAHHFSLDSYYWGERWTLSPVLSYELRLRPFRLEAGIGFGPLGYGAPWSAARPGFSNGTYFASVSLVSRVVLRAAVSVTSFLDVLARMEVGIASPLNSWSNFPGSYGSLTAGVQLRLFP